MNQDDTSVLKAAVYTLRIAVLHTFRVQFGLSIKLQKVTLSVYPISLASKSTIEMSGDDSIEASGDGISKDSALSLEHLVAFVVAGFVVFLVGVVVVVLVVLWVKRRRRGRRGKWTVPGVDYHYRGKKGLQAGVANAVYACKLNN